MNWKNSILRVERCARHVAGRRPRCRRGPVARRTAGCTWSHQNDQKASHSFGMSARVKPALLQQALPDVDVVGCAAHRQRVQGLLPSPRLSKHRTSASASGSNRSEKVADSVRKVHEPIVEGPLRGVDGNCRCRTRSRAAGPPRAPPRSSPAARHCGWKASSTCLPVSCSNAAMISLTASSSSG